MLKKKTLLICTFLPQPAEGPAPIGLGDAGLKKGILSGRKKQGESMYLLRVPLRSLGNWMLVILGEGVCAQERSPLYLHSLGSHL